MSCEVCAGYSSYNCPYCGDATRVIVCPDCEGSGYAPYKAFDLVTRKAVPVTELAYRMLPEDEDVAKRLRMRYCKMDIEICPTCKGVGEIPE